MIASCYIGISLGIMLRVVREQKLLIVIWPSVNTGCLFIPVSFRHFDLFLFIFVFTACLIKFDPTPVPFIKCIGVFSPSDDKIICGNVLLVLE